MERIYGKGKRTIGGKPITSASIKAEGSYWRWIIRTATATYVDGGNYGSRWRAIKGLDQALDPEPIIPPWPKHPCGRCGSDGAAGAAGLCLACTEDSAAELGAPDAQ